MIGAESLLGRPDLETTRKGHTRAAPEAQKRAKGWRRFCSLLGHVSANSEQPQRKIARASLPAVNYTTTERAVYFAFLNSAKARDAPAYFLYHEQLDL
jgi:hypothetical protein